MNLDDPFMQMINSSNDVTIVGAPTAVKNGAHSILSVMKDGGMGG
jgi:hypothetical protein